jgi:hypothetical protein
MYKKARNSPHNGREPAVIRDEVPDCHRVILTRCTTGYCGDLVGYFEPLLRFQ